MSAAKLAAQVLVGIALAWIAFELTHDERFPVREMGVRSSPDEISAGVAYRRERAGSSNRHSADIFQVPYSRMAKAEWSEIWGPCGVRVGRAGIENRYAANVAVVGDSIGYGAEVDYEDALAGRLQERVAANITNVAMSGTNSEIYGRIARLFLSCLDRRASAAVIGLYNDVLVGDIGRWLATDEYAGRAALDGVTVSRATYDRAMRSWLYRMGFDLQVAARNWSSLYNRLFPPVSREDFAIPIFDKLTPENMQAWENRIVRHLDAAGAELKLPPERIVVWIEPSIHELTDIVLSSRRGRETTPYFGTARQFWRRVADRLAQGGYRVVDVQDEIQGLYLKQNVFPYTASGHYRPQAYHIIAERIAPELTRMLAMD